MYENDKYVILKIENMPGPKFECVVQFLEPKKEIVHIFMNDRYLEEDLLIKRLDNKWEREYNRNDKEIEDKKGKLADLTKKMCKKPK